MAAERYEDRHRTLRQPVATHIQRRKGPGQPGTDTTWTQVDVSALMSFEARTGRLVDDLVAAVRMMHRINHGDDCRACDVGELLAALDEASGRG